MLSNAPCPPVVRHIYRHDDPEHTWEAAEWFTPNWNGSKYKHPVVVMNITGPGLDVFVSCWACGHVDGLGQVSWKHCWSKHEQITCFGESHFFQIYMGSSSWTGVSSIARFDDSRIFQIPTDRCGTASRCLERELESLIIDSWSSQPLWLYID